MFLGSITFDGTLTQLHADKHQQTAKMENTGQVRVKNSKEKYSLIYLLFRHFLSQCQNQNLLQSTSLGALFSTPTGLLLH